MQVTIPSLCDKIEDQGYQPTADQTFICSQIGMNDHAASLEAKCGLHFESPIRCLLSMPQLPLQISSYPKALTILD